MSKPLKPRRGTTAENNAFVGEAYEVTYDTDKNTLVCRDGLTAGGFPLATEGEVTTQLSSLDTSIRAVIAEEVAKYLPLDGSQPMTGRLQLPHSAEANSRRNDTDGTFIECSLGFHDDQGALVIARRKDSTAYDQAGMVGLKACDGAEIKYLLGYPNGKIQWDSKTVLTVPDYARQIYGTCAPNVRITAAETSLVICWGSVNMINGSFTLVSPSGDVFAVGYYHDDQNYYSVGHSQTFICPAGWSFYAGVGFEYRIYPMGKNC